ncbi:Neuroendocrine convertase 1 [Thelohanellus kitauei]|uniref:Neuroendocrine convertase 1 n=1 Tax=Thelohanellus kitauei TaxID=669202 RepID=A0A0C2NCG0_THEKT|nr:Neuroendocrine convertase 1 [Thelohanellus kitauei]
MDIFFKVIECNVNYVEHLQITFSADLERRGDLAIDIISPQGTISPLLDTRNEDDSNQGFENWTMTSVHFWGENPRGIWLVRFKDANKYRKKHIQVIIDCVLMVHGTLEISFYQSLFLEFKNNNTVIHRDKVDKYTNRRSTIPTTYQLNKRLNELLQYMKYINLQNYIN